MVARLNRNRLVAHQLADLLGADEHGVHSGPLEGEHFVAGRDFDLGDRELPGRYVREQLEHRVEWIDVLVDVVRVQEEDLGIEPFERQLELLFVAHVDDCFKVVVIAVLVGLMRTASASLGAPVPSHRRGRLVAPLMPSISTVIATASAPWASAALAAPASSTQTMIEIPSPSEMRWLRRRVIGTCSWEA